MRINGVPHRKGDQWGKKVPGMDKKIRPGCLSVLIPTATIPRRVAPAPPRVAGRPALTQVPTGRPARGRAS